jgi:tetratricopeptide (TPR) repeat protein
MVKEILYIILIAFAFPADFIKAQKSNNFEIHVAAQISKKAYRAAINLYPANYKPQYNNSEFTITLGTCYLNLGMIDSALYYFEEVNKIKHHKTDFLIARAYARKNDAENAVLYLEEHLKSRYKLPKTTVKLHQDFEKIAGSKEWKAFWLKDWYNKRDEFVSKVKYLLKYNNNLEALKLMDEKINRRTRNPEYYKLRARAYYHLKNYPKAVDDLTDAIKIDDNSPELYRARSEAYEKLDKPEKAIDDLNRAIEIEPGHFPDYTKRARLHLKNNNYNASINDMNVILNYFPDNIEAHYLKGKACLENKEYIKALTHINKCISADSSQSIYFETRGDIYSQTKMYKFAEQDYLMALDLNPFSGDIYTKKGISRLKNGNKKGACSDWQKAMLHKNREAKKLFIKHCH